MSKRNPVFFKYRGITIYRTYHERYDDITNEYWYSTSPTKHARYMFDVRDMGGGDSHKGTIKRAIDNHRLNDSSFPVAFPKKKSPVSRATVTAVELNAILCGLRLVQRDGYLGEFGKVRALTGAQIDDLCVRLNLTKSIKLEG
jgi:hypothetical protein